MSWLEKQTPELVVSTCEKATSHAPDSDTSTTAAAAHAAQQSPSDTAMETTGLRMFRKVKPGTPCKLHISDAQPQPSHQGSHDANRYHRTKRRRVARHAEADSHVTQQDLAHLAVDGTHLCTVVHRRMCHIWQQTIQLPASGVIVDPKPHFVPQDVRIHKLLGRA